MPNGPWYEEVGGVAGTGLTQFGQFFESFPGSAYQRTGKQIEALGQALTALATGSGANFDLNEFQQDYANNLAAGMGIAAFLSETGLAALTAAQWEAAALSLGALAPPIGIALTILGVIGLWWMEENFAELLEFGEEQLMGKLADLLRSIFADPIVLDLDGDGIELTALSASTTHYDIDDDGSAERTGWVSPHDGLLVHDANGNGVADGIAELFGGANVDGYDELAQLDSNQDGLIDTNDAAFAGLMVWRDLNGDGAATSDEMLTLAQAGILSFNLAFTQTDTEVDGNIVARMGTYIRIDNSTRDMGSVQFALDEGGDIPTLPQGTDISDLLVLPNLPGLPALPDLRTAMFLDPTLQAMVADLVLGEHGFDSFVDFEQGGFLDVLYRWAGIDTTVTLAPGDVPFHYQLLAAFTGKPFDDLNPHQIQRLEDEIWPQFIQQMGIRFLFQAAWNPTLQPYLDLSHAVAALDPDSPTFDDDVAAATANAIAAAGAITPAYDYLKLFTGLTLNPFTGALYGDFDAFVANYIEDEPSFFTSTMTAGGGGGGGGGGPVIPTMSSSAEGAEGRHPWTAWYEDQGSLLFSIAGAMEIAPDYVLNVTGWRWLAGEATDLQGTDGADLIDQTITYFDRLVQSGSGSASVQVETHDQRIFGYEGDDELRGNDGVDRLVGGTGDDLLKGGSDSDMYVYAAGDGLDRIVDDSGSADTIYFSSELSNADLRVARLTGTNDLLVHFGDPAAGIILTGQWSSPATAVEQFHFVAQDGLDAGDIASLYLATLATAAADTLTGSWAGERLIGLEGNDSLSGLDGDDSLDGGGGDDQLLGGNGSDLAVGGDGNDTIYLADGNDQLVGGAGNDRLEGGGGEDTYIYNAGDGDDVIYDYWNWDDTVADTLVFGAGIAASDLLLSRASDWLDIRIGFVGQAGSILIDNQNYSDTGIEKVMFADGTVWNHAQLMARYVFDQQTAGDDIIWGSNLADVAEAGTGNDIVSTADGDDTLVGGAGNDRLEGGSGLDTYVYNAGDGDDVIYDYWNWDDTVADTLLFGAGIAASGLVFSRVASDWLDIRIGFAGQAGSILLDNQNYTDTGIEQIVFADGTVWNHAQIMARYVADQQTAGNDTIWGSNLADTASGGDGADVIETMDGDDTLNGGTGNDLLRGQGGNDVLDGGTGADAMEGGTGNDWYYVDNAGDTVTDAVGQGADRVFASTSWTLTAGAEVEIFSTTNHAGTGAINLTGNALANTIFGNAGNNILDGKAGADALVGWAGDDIFYVDNGGDAVTEAANEGSDRVFASASWTLTAGASVELMTTDFHAGTNAIDLTGNALANTIYGNAGSNVLDGKGGSDTLVGNPGADSFAFTTALGAGNVDRLVDFSGTDDTIRLDDAVFIAIGSPGALDANAFVTGTAAADASDRIIYNSGTGQLYYDADGTGAGAAVLFATLDAAPALAAGDFLVI